MSDGEQDSSDDRPTPPVPPTDGTRIPPRHTDIPSKVLDKEMQDVTCPHCRQRRVFLIERQTGAEMVGHWDPETFDSDKFRLETSWHEVGTIEKCKHCGYRREIA